MAKILLVEDDKSLREIYGVRLQAEGYTIVSAGDGEEALAIAIKERPDLIVSDVMMPKISGFDMLDILRSTSETKNVKVIMMTALSSDDQRARGESLGADRYLVKSQVGIEDVVRTVHDVLADGVAGAAAAPVAAAPVSEPAAVAPEPAPAPVAEPLVAAAPTPEPYVAPAPIPEPIAQPAPVPVAPAPQPFTQPTPVAAAPAFTPEPFGGPAPVVTPTPTVISDILPPAPAAPAPVQAPVAPVVAAPSPFSTPAPAPAPVAMPQPTAPFSSPAPASLGERVIQPLTNPTETVTPPDIAAQMNQALGGAPAPAPGTPPVPPQF